MSEITFGIHPRQIGSRNALRDICNVVENSVEPEVEKVETQPEGIRASVAVLKEVACGYGYGGAVDESVLETEVSRLEDYNALPKVDLSADERDALLNICHIVGATVEPRAEKVRDVELAWGLRKSPKTTLYLGEQGVGCSVEAVKKIACGQGFENEKKDIRVEVDCLKQFLDQVRRHGVAVPP